MERVLSELYRTGGGLPALKLLQEVQLSLPWAALLDPWTRAGVWHWCWGLPERSVKDN